MAGVERFVEAQRGVWDTALGKLRAGAKRSHWMWYIFPQIAGLGQSETARFYAIADLAEARAYLAHPELGSRLCAAIDAMLDWAGKRSAETVLGRTDAMKFRSSLTLFEAAGWQAADGGERFSRALDAFFAGACDETTLALLG